MGGPSGEQHGDAPRRSQVRGRGGRGARRRRGDPDGAGRPARRTARDDGAPHPAAAGPDADRSLVLRRPLRSRRGLAVRRHGRGPPPAHRPPDGQLAVQRGDRAPGQRGQPRARQTGRGEPHDGRSRHQPLRGVHPGHHGPARRPALGGAALGAPRHRSGLPAPRPRPGGPGRRRGARLPRLARGGHLTGRHLHAPARRRGDPGPGRHRDPRRRPRLRARSPRRQRRRTPRRHGRAPRRTGLRRTGTKDPRTDQCGIRRRPAGGAGRSALPGGDRHVVELRRTHPRRDRGRQSGLGERGGALRPGRGLPRRPPPAPALPNATLSPRRNPRP